MSISKTYQNFDQVRPTSLIDLIEFGLRFSLRLVGFLVIVVMFFMTNVPILLVTRGERRQRIIMNVCQYYSKLWNFIFNVHVHKNIDGLEHGPCMIVSNHLSYLDIPVIASVAPCLFITSVEIKNTPVLGHICQAAACLFVERRNRLKINSEISEIRDALKAGLNITIFPEGTSTNGSHILPFKKSLLHASVGSGARIVPICLNYTHVSGEVINTKSRDSVCWYGDMSFLPHFVRFLSLKRLDVEINVGGSFSADKAPDRNYIAERSRKVIVERFSPIS